MSDHYQLFRRTTPDWVRLVVASVCAVGMLAFNGPPPVRAMLAFTLIAPVQRVVSWSKAKVSDTLVHSYHIQRLVEQNHDLQTKNQQQATQLLELNQLRTDNQTLRAQMGMQQVAAHSWIHARVLYQVTDPYMRKLILSAGSRDGAQVGQPVLTQDGLLGQISAVQINSSEVTLITDTKINVPVMVQRNPSVRGFVSGHKSEGYLELRIFNQESADLQTGDVLVTSGLDGLYPAGIAVAKVTDIKPSGSDGRSELTIVPVSATMNARYVAVMNLNNLIELKTHSDAQSKMVQDNPVPTTLGARTREQFKK